MKGGLSEAEFVDVWYCEEHLRAARALAMLLALLWGVDKPVILRALSPRRMRGASGAWWHESRIPFCEVCEWERLAQRDVPETGREADF